MDTSIHISALAPGLHLRAALRSEALPELIALVQHFRTESTPLRPPGPSPHWRVGRHGPDWPPADPGRMRRRMGHDSPPVEPGPAAETARELFRNLEWPALAALLPGLKFGEKILLLTAWLEAQNGSPVFKGELRARFAQTSEPFPANPGRDTRALILAGFLSRTDDRTRLSLTPAGWEYAARLADADGEASAAVPS